ncbi:hypothetical protein C8R45DRAFT_923834 [Mycena sanguinolenta]|nr:hypothetical protein C8R45DRAFT_923834 [Mycena sanguinolenta]
MSQARVEQASSACTLSYRVTQQGKQMRTLRFKTLKHSRKGAEYAYGKQLQVGNLEVIRIPLQIRVNLIERERELEARRGRKPLNFRGEASAGLKTAGADPPLRDFETLEKRTQDMHDIESSSETWEYLEFRFRYELTGIKQELRAGGEASIGLKGEDEIQGRPQTRRQ